MSDSLDVAIDISPAGLGLEPNELEEYALRLSQEMSDLTETAELVRSMETPEQSKSGLAGFDLGIIKAEVNLQNLKKLLDWLGSLFYGKTLELQYEENENGTKISFKYQSDKQLEQQIQAIERIKNLQVKVVKAEN
ncbi:hypothetical protein [Leptolyngbya sp. NIES-2104]|uniref:hypothetical protein n=1 Tax=Leptolyngbya sp. NIES-2104 TaxID=1552121 RepID=UPI0006ECC7CA|nr:hypothetical protein [Leptolyngbya sp. NIES-2104]GAP93877.1 hypothetical protein NIES2104_03860 [Leptolyngbya sp. NIES-2104]